MSEEYFTFQFRPVGSYSGNMITYDLKSNIGNAMDQAAPGYGYKYYEDLIRALTIKR